MMKEVGETSAACGAGVSVVAGWDVVATLVVVVCEADAEGVV
jgi:hypothetical protein